MQGLYFTSFRQGRVRRERSHMTDFGEYKYVCGFCDNYDTAVCENCDGRKKFVPKQEAAIPEDMVEHYTRLRKYYDGKEKA